MARFGVFLPPPSGATLSHEHGMAVDSSGGERTKSINQATIMGHVGRDLDIRFTQNGRKIVAFSVATTESWRGKGSGDRIERTEWHRVVIMNEALTTIVEKFVHKGTAIHLTGKLQVRHWIDKKKQDRYATEIVLLPYAGDLILLDRKEPDDTPEADGGDNRDMTPAVERPDLDDVPL